MIVKKYRKNNMEISVGYLKDKGKKQWYISTTDLRIKDSSTLSGDILLQPNKKRAMKNFELNAERMGFKKVKDVI